MPEYDPQLFALLFNIVKSEKALANPSLWFAEILMYLLGAVLLYHAIKTYGKWRALMFFIGCFLVTGIEESVAILIGTTLPGGGSYFYTLDVAGIFWFIAIPIVNVIGWFNLSYPTYYIMTKLFPEWQDWKKSAGAGLLALNYDFLIDPISVRQMKWQWLSGPPGSPIAPEFYIFGIPFGNYLGWFIMVFFFLWFWMRITSDDQLNEWGQKKTTIIYLLGVVGIAFLVQAIALPTIAIVHAICPAGYDLTFGGI